MIIPNEILDGVPVTQTSTFPYQSIGPIDFSQINFVRTEQTDYYYGYPDSSSTQQVLLAEVKQVNDPAETILVIAALIFGFIYFLVKFIKFVSKQGK